MTWHEMFHAEVRRLRAFEEDVVPTLERVRAQVAGSPAQEVLDDLVEAVPGRLMRVDIVCGFAGWSFDKRTPHVLEGWNRDMDELMGFRPKGDVLDATILSFVLKIARLRTTGYETAFLLADALGAHDLARLLAPMWEEDRTADDQASEALAALIRRGGDDWEEILRQNRVG